MRYIILILFNCFILFSIIIKAQVKESETGLWLMYFYTTQFKNSNFGLQGDIQYRNWNIGTDLEQLLLRSAVNYKLKEANVTFALGYAHITNGTFGDNNKTTTENRMYQEILLPQKVGNRLYFSHRFRYEQRWVENQDFRTRYRYFLSLNIPFNSKELDKKVFYVALYNEIFINGQRSIGNKREVELFDRNRTYLGMGYGISKNIRIQAGWMNQLTDNLGKGQLQLSVYHKF